MLGNAWHIPDNAEPPFAPGMRSPLEEATVRSEVAIFSGNQFKGGAEAADQHQTGSKLHFKKSTETAWQDRDLVFRSRSGNNEYYEGLIPANSFQAGDLVQYYVRIAYDPNQRQTTFLHGTDGESRRTGDEGAARADPFTFTVGDRPAITGGVKTFDLGPLQARIEVSSGVIELAGPDLAGAAGAVTITFLVGASVGDRPRRIGRVVSATNIADGFELQQQVGDGNGVGPVRTRLTLRSPGVLRFEVVDWNGLRLEKTFISAAAAPDEHFYGFGEKFNSLDQAGHTVRTVTFDQPGDKGDRSYKPCPWFVSSRGYGFHLDSTAESLFDMRTARTERYVVANFLPALALNIVYGPKLTDVLRRFAGLAGRPPLPPPFAFGPWISSDIWRNGAGVRYVIDKLRELKIPTSVIVFDSPWETAYNDFQFNARQFFNDLPAADRTYEGRAYDQFGSLTEMMRYLQRNGLKVICWLTPLINDVSRTNEGIGDLKVGGQLAKSPNFDDGVHRGVFVRQAASDLVVHWWKGRGRAVDFTNPAARRWLTDQLQKLVADCEVTVADGTKETALGGFKPDDGEALTNLDSADTPGGEYIPRNAAYHDGRTGREMRNGYCVEYLKTLYGVLGDKGLIFARSGFMGTQALPACWAGDNKQDFSPGDGLPSVIVAGQSAAMSGFAFWSHDIGGYQNRTDLSAAEKADVFIRWTQFGCFTPIMQLHRQPVVGELRQYPWGYPVGGGENFDKSVALDNYRFFARLHTKLFPYIYSYAKAAHVEGLPIMRPLVLLHQDDPNVFTIEHTYYFGGEFLVAPVIEPNADGRQVYLPAGDWFEFWTNRRLQGGRTIAWKADGAARFPEQFQFPLFVRAGAIVPQLLNVPDTICDAGYVNASGIRALEEIPGLLFLVYPQGDSQFTVYDGTTATCRVGGRKITLQLTSVARRVGFNVLVPQQPTGVLLNNNNLPGPLTPAQFEQATSGWHFDDACRFVRLKFPHAGALGEVTIATT